MLSAKMPDSVLPLVLWTVLLVISIGSGLVALLKLVAPRWTAKVIVGVAYAGVTYTLSVLLGFVSVFAYSGCGACA